MSGCIEFQVPLPDTELVLDSQVCSPWAQLSMLNFPYLGSFPFSPQAFSCYKVCASKRGSKTSVSTEMPVLGHASFAREPVSVWLGLPLAKGKTIWDVRALCYCDIDSYLVHGLWAAFSKYVPGCPAWWRSWDTRKARSKLKPDGGKPRSPRCSWSQDKSASRSRGKS